MRNLAQMISNEPNVLFGRHPAVPIEARKVYRLRIATKSAFAPQIEIDVKITQGQFAQRAIDGFAIPASGKVRFRHRPPVISYLKNGDDVVGILVGLQVEN